MTNHNKPNPAFEYVKENYNIDCTIYRELAKSIHTHASSAAEQFANEFRRNSNEEIIHFFFDYFLFFFSIARRQSLPKENDSYSAILDGIHIEYYDNVNPQIIDNMLKLMTTKEFCFLKTNYHLYKKRDLKMSMTIASYCILKPDFPGATEILKLEYKFEEIHDEKLRKIDNEFGIIRKK